jgi:predicted ferric reductase/Ca2+-binding EF-hand superfamily protein
MTAEREIDTGQARAAISDVAELGAPMRHSDVAPVRHSAVAPVRHSAVVLKRATTDSMVPSSGAPLALDEPLLALLQECFSELAGPDSRLDAADFQRSLAVKDAFLAERVLAVFDRNRDGWVTRVEFLRGIPRLLFGSVRDKLRFAFRLHDLDGDGVIERAEISRMIELGLSEDGAPPQVAVSERFTLLLLQAADENHDGCLSFTEFEALALHHPDLTELITRAERSWVTTGRELGEPDAVPSRAARILRFLDNHTAAVTVVALWLFANAALFTRAWLAYEARGATHAVMLARGAGACLNLNGALVVLPMARRVATWLRRTTAARVLPVDDAVAFHRLLGTTLVLFSLVHTAAHLFNYSLGRAGVAASLFGTQAGKTGFMLLVVLGVLFAFSRKSVRASGRFELFYRTHLLYPVWFALALVHGPAFWVWACVPLGVFAVDKLLRLRRTATEATVTACVPLASGVTKLSIEKPTGFVHTPGDYVYLKLPALAPHEWHPFTISSAPEQPLVTLHVRSLGNFTSALYALARKRARASAPEPLLSHLDGPFGTPSTRIFEAKRAVLIGAGIGVTPFASVLESIVLRDRAGTGSLEKVHFYWLNRDAVSFEWFAALLAELERRDTRALVEVHIFMTGGRGDSTAMLLNLARDLAHASGDLDVFTGLRAKTQMGAPDWRSELTQAAGDDPTSVDVFFCGPPGLRRAVARVCSELDLRFHAEQF